MNKQMWQLSEEEHANLEIDTQNYLLKNSKKMKFNYNEIKELQRNLDYWKKQKEWYRHGK